MALYYNRRGVQSEVADHDQLRTTIQTAVETTMQRAEGNFAQPAKKAPRKGAFSTVFWW